MFSHLAIWHTIIDFLISINDNNILKRKKKLVPSLTPLFSFTPHIKCIRKSCWLSSKYFQKQATFHYVHCQNPGLSYYCLSTGLRQYPHNQSLCFFIFPFQFILSRKNSKCDPVKCKSSITLLSITCALFFISLRVKVKFLIRTNKSLQDLLTCLLFVLISNLLSIAPTLFLM